jgi:NHL repeat
MKAALRLTAVVVFMTLGVIAGASSEAWAGQGYEAITGTFGKACEASPCPAGQFSGPTGVAVSYETGDVYVVDSGNDRVQWFNATGTSIEGQFDGSGEYEVKTTKKTGAPAAQGTLLEPEGIAVDNDPASPSFQDVYVADVGHHVIDKFSATGEYLGDLEGPFSGGLNVALDAEGNVWAYETQPQEAKVYEFDAEGTLIKPGSSLAGWGEAALVPGFAVDAKDDLYVTGGRYSVYEYEAGNTEERKVIKQPVNRQATLAVLSSTGRLLIDEQSNIEVLGSPPRVFPSEGLSESSGVAVNGANGEGTLYASQHGRDDVAYFDPGTPSAPEILSATLTSTSREEGAFEVVINPNDRNTTYEIEYSTKVSANGKELEGEIHTLSGTELPAEFNKDKETVPGAILENSNSSYYYRVIANNGEKVETEIKVYTKLPTVLPGEILELTSTGATLLCNPGADFVATKYTFYIADKYQFEHDESVPIDGITGLLHQKRLEVAEAICPGIIEEGASGTLPEETNTLCPVTAELEGLTPGETYYFRVVATNEVTKHTSNANKGAPVIGEWVSFTPYPPPRATGGQATAVTANSAFLSGEVNPEGAAGSYYFAYITASEYEEALQNGAANPNEPGYQTALEHGAASPYTHGTTTTPATLPASKTPQAAGPSLAAGLLPATTYHYTLVATNQYGLRTYGPDHTLTTQPGTPPNATTGAASSITQTTATLSGTINTNGLATSYGFEIATTPGNYGPPTALGTVPGGETREVRGGLGELQPGTTYYFRITATSSAGIVHGAEGSFTTLALPALIMLPTTPANLGFVAPKEPPVVKHHQPTPLEKALKACKKHKNKPKRLACEKTARHKHKTTTTKHNTKK